MDLEARLQNLEEIVKVPVLLSLLVVTVKSAAGRNAPAPLPKNRPELYRSAINDIVYKRVGGAPVPGDICKVTKVIDGKKSSQWGKEVKITEELWDGQYLVETLEDKKTRSYHMSSLQVTSRDGDDSSGAAGRFLELLRVLFYANHIEKRVAFDLSHVTTAIEATVNTPDERRQLWDQWKELGHKNCLPCLKVVTAPDSTYVQGRDAYFASEKGVDETKTELEENEKEDATVGLGLYQSSHLSMQEYVFVSELAKNKDREQIEEVIRQGDKFYLNAFGLLGELGPEAPSLITSFVDKECTMNRVKLLMVLHQVHPQLTNVDLRNSYDLKGTEWERFCLFSCGCSYVRACVQVQVCGLCMHTPHYPTPSWMCVCVQGLSRPLTHIQTRNPPGPMPMLLFVLLLEGKANMKETSFTLPSNDDVEQAPADLKQRVQAIESVDLSGMDRLTGNGNQFPIRELPL